MAGARKGKGEGKIGRARNAPGEGEEEGRARAQFYPIPSLIYLKLFIDYLNNINSTIKFISSHSSTNIPFLDVNVSLTNDGNISTDLYTKPADKHQHLLYSSCHPLHTKKAIPFSLALRLRRICSTDATFHTRTAQLATYLLKRGYNRNFVNKQIRRAADIPRQLTLQTKDINKPKRIPFITTFNPSLPHIIKKHFTSKNISHHQKTFQSVALL